MCMNWHRSAPQARRVLLLRAIAQRLCQRCLLPALTKKHWLFGCHVCRSLAISSNEEQLVLSLAGGPAFTLALNNQELMKADDMNFELLGPGMHTAGAPNLPWPSSMN